MICRPNDNPISPTTRKNARAESVRDHIERELSPALSWWKGASIEDLDMLIRTVDHEMGQSQRNEILFRFAKIGYLTVLLSVLRE